MNFYNDIDRHAAAWLRELIKQGHLPPGDVSETPIQELDPNELRRYRQVHLFAGVGGWPLALQLAGVPADRPLWTGSCPCQPFSNAGKQKGHEDERHLWPAMHRLIAECRPPIVFGEQVEAAIRLGWVDGVQADLEAEGYAFGFSVLGAHSVGAPHIRQRLFWVANACGTGVRDGGPGSDGAASKGSSGPARQQRVRPDAGATGGLAHPQHPDRRRGEQGQQGQAGLRRGGSANGCPFCGYPVDPAAGRYGCANCEGGGLEHADHAGREQHGGAEPVRAEQSPSQRASSAGWDDFIIIIPCGDGKSRRIEPGIAPLVDGLSVSLERLRSIENSAIQEVLNYGQSVQGNAGEVLRLVRDAVSPQAGGQGQSVGVCLQLHEAEVLRPFLLRLDAALEAGQLGGSVPQAGNEVHAEGVRSVQDDQRTVCSPHRRQPDEQQQWEPANSVLELSRILAWHAEAYRQTAANSHAATSRVTQIRGYGNAIVPQVAAAFIEEVMGVIDQKN